MAGYRGLAWTEKKLEELREETEKRARTLDELLEDLGIEEYQKDLEERNRYYIENVVYKQESLE